MSNKMNKHAHQEKVVNKHGPGQGEVNQYTVTLRGEDGAITRIPVSQDIWEKLSIGDAYARA